MSMAKKVCSQKKCECLAWLSFLVNSIGDHQPDSGLIHLPSCFTKLSLYRRMCRELGEEVIVSQSQFYSLMEKQLGNVVIPKVSAHVPYILIQFYILFHCLGYAVFGNVIKK